MCRKPDYFMVGMVEGVPWWSSRCLCFITTVVVVTAMTSTLRIEYIMLHGPSESVRRTF